MRVGFLIILLTLAGVAEAVTIRTKNDLRLWQTVFDRTAPLAWNWSDGADAATVTFSNRLTGAVSSCTVGRETGTARGSCPQPAISATDEAFLSASVVQTANGDEVSRWTADLAYVPGAAGQPTSVRTKGKRDWYRVPVRRVAGFDAAPGANRFTWDPSSSAWAGKTLANFTVVSLPATTNAHKYLVVDLEKGGYSFLSDVPAGGWSDEYKTSKMPFRRIPAGTYQLGMESNVIAKVYGKALDAQYAKSWKRHDVAFSSDFYVAVFKMTVAQYNLLKGTAADTDKKPKAVSYDELRGEATADGINWPTSHYAVASSSLVSALRAKAGSDLVVDLCQECQWEAAMRAGTTTIWSNGGTLDDNADVLEMTVGQIAWLDGALHEVGLKADNGWGIYDSVGNGVEWTLDKASKCNGSSTLPKYGLSDATDPTGSSKAYATYRVIRGGTGKTPFDLLPCRRIVSEHANVAAAVRFCIHLKPLAFTE